jgi:hypothetical protein
MGKQYGRKAGRKYKNERDKGVEERRCGLRYEGNYKLDFSGVLH